GWCRRKKIPYTTNKEMVQKEKVKARYQKEMKILNADFSNFEQIKRFELIDYVWCIDGGELTPTLKLKRKNILAKNKDLYAKIYC
ncbi:MAG: long-chain fatty acid--CoA ligase, partial [Vicingaceae bacterium]